MSMISAAVAASTGRSLARPWRYLVMPTGTREQLENCISVRSRRVRRSWSPSFQPGQTTICPFITIPALQKARI